MSWEDLQTRFAAAVRRYYSQQGAEPSEATLRTNTELVPRRAQVLAELLPRLSQRESMSGLDVIEAGSGFGALAAYIALTFQPASLVAFDAREDYVELSRESTHELDLPLRYEVADMREFGGFDAESVDLALVNNAFIYLPTADDMDRALTALARVVRPGGSVLLHHTNKWRLRDPFSKDPLVHLLPPDLAERVSERTGWQHNHGRVRLLSASELKRRLQDAGFGEVKVGTHYLGKARGAVGYLAPYYAVGGRRL